MLKFFIKLKDMIKSCLNCSERQYVVEQKEITKLYENEYHELSDIDIQNVIEEPISLSILINH